MTGDTSRCDRPDCDGVVGPTGFCDLRGHRQARSGTAGTGAIAPAGTAGHPSPVTPPGPASAVPARPRPGPTRALAAPPGSDPGTGPTARKQRREARRLFTIRPPAGDGLLDLPVIDLPSPADLIKPDPQSYRRQRHCGWQGCRGVVGAAHAGQPGLRDGFCPLCGHRFDLSPQLSPGDELGNQYRVVGCLGEGGNGWIYLATQPALDDKPVAIKGLRDPYDDRALSEIIAERRNLTLAARPHIVRIISYETRPVRHSDALAGYIVMDFVPGMSLQAIRDLIAAGEEPFSGPQLFEYILAYGCLILDALGYMHGEKLLYCDMKPDNVMHYRGKISVIDLGGYAGSTTTAGRSPAPAAIRNRGQGSSHPWVERTSDLYSVGRTLSRLSEASHQLRAGLGARVYQRAIARATATDPRDRFASAQEMSEQLRGVLREIRSLRTEREHPEASTLFAPTVRLLDAGIGEPPPLEHWLGGRPRGVLAHGLPAPIEVGPALPEPYPAKTDPGKNVLRTPTSSGLRRQLEQLSAFYSATPSADIPLRQCRIHLELGEPGPARERLARAREVIGALAPYDWRLNWHLGLIRLAEGDVAAARCEFERVYDALPGEYAPKLALGYCAEHGDRADEAERYYQAVWQRNRAAGSAAFGLARLRIAVGDRRGAVRVLDGVPKVSRHYDAAQIAAARILTGRLGGGPQPAPSDGWGLPDADDVNGFLWRRTQRLLAENMVDEQALWRLDAEALDAALARAHISPADAEKLAHRLRTRCAGRLRSADGRGLGARTAAGRCATGWWRPYGGGATPNR